jgi:nicotinate-nucleotide adenylyltransferase
MPEPDPRRFICLGGSFDPVHLGHLAVARAAAEAAGYEGVRLIVANDSPGKRAKADAEHRIAMCRLAVADDPEFLVDDRELHRPGPSYTADTAAALRDELGTVPAWLIGTDLLPTLPRWHRADELLADPATLARFVVVTRGGHELDLGTLPSATRHVAATCVTVPQWGVSSTLVRERLASSKSIRYLVPEPVRHYIQEHGLYAA